MSATSARSVATLRTRAKTDVSSTSPLTWGFRILFYSHLFLESLTKMTHFARRRAQFETPITNHSPTNGAFCRGSAFFLTTRSAQCSSSYLLLSTLSFYSPILRNDTPCIDHSAVNGRLDCSPHFVSLAGCFGLGGTDTSRSIGAATATATRSSPHRHPSINNSYNKKNKHIFIRPVRAPASVRRRWWQSPRPKFLFYAPPAARQRRLHAARRPDCWRLSRLDATRL